MNITIPLLPEWKEKMLSEIKICTTRTRRYGKKDDNFDAFGATFRIIAVSQQSLNFVATHLYQVEGCDSSQEFIDIWERLHPIKGFDPDQKVFSHFFKMVKGTTVDWFERRAASEGRTIRQVSPY